MIEIIGWNENYETNESRKLVTLNWVKIPNKHDGLAFRRISAHPRGAEIFAAWILIVQVASKRRKGERGNLPLSPDELGIVTGFPADIFKMAIDELKSPKIGWIKQSPDGSAESPDALGKSPSRVSTGDYRTEHLNGAEKSNYGKFKETCDRLFGKPVTHQEEAAQMRLIPELERIGASIADLELRVKNARSGWNNAQITLQAVLKNWTQLRDLKPKGEKKSAPIVDWVE